MAVGSGAIARGSASSLPRVPSNGRLGDGGAVSLNGHVGPSSSQAIVQVHGHGHGLGQAHGGTLIKAQQQQQHGQGYSQAHGGALVQAQLQLYGHGQTPALGVALVQAQAQQQSHAHAAQKRKMLSQFDELEGAYFQLRRWVSGRGRGRGGGRGRRTVGVGNTEIMGGYGGCARVGGRGWVGEGGFVSVSAGRWWMWWFSGVESDSVTLQLACRWVLLVRPASLELLMCPRYGVD